MAHHFASEFRTAGTDCPPCRGDRAGQATRRITGGIRGAGVIYLAALVASLGAWCAPPAQAASSDVWAGKTLWVAPGEPIRVCPRPGAHIPLQAGCAERRRGRFVVERPVEAPFPAGRPGETINIGYFVRFSDGKSGYVTKTALISALSHQPDTAAERCRHGGKITLGMSRAQVYGTCLGRPQGINTTITVTGRHEQLVYPGGYIYLTDGIVTGIQTFR